MPFTARNCYYLRISKTTVLPTYVYLDERHINWMSDTVLQHVLSDLRPNILSKLKAEADLVIAAGSSTKKPTVDTHRGDSYQFCYFLRRTEPHSVIVKSRTFSAAQPLPPRQQAPTKKPANKKGKRKAVSSNSRSSKKRAKTTDPILVESSDDNDEDFTMNDPQDDDYLPPGPEDEAVNEVSLEVEEEEAKPKPVLGLKHQGFSIYGSCLCIVVEPWPVVRAMTGVAAALAKMPSKPSNEAQPQRESSKQPLFLPEDPEEEMAEKSEPVSSTKRYVNKAYLKQVLDEVIEISDDSDKSEDEGGMMEFTQVLRNVGDTRAGAMNDDEDMDGSVLFGDADEYREL